MVLLRRLLLGSCHKSAFLTGLHLGVQGPPFPEGVSDRHQDQAQSIGAQEHGPMFHVQELLSVGLANSPKRVGRAEFHEKLVAGLQQRIAGKRIAPELVQDNPEHDLAPFLQPFLASGVARILKGTKSLRGVGLDVLGIGQVIHPASPLEPTLPSSPGGGFSVESVASGLLRQVGVLRRLVHLPFVGGWCIGVVGEGEGIKLPEEGEEQRLPRFVGPIDGRGPVSVEGDEGTKFVVPGVWSGCPASVWPLAVLSRATLPPAVGSSRHLQGWVPSVESFGGKRFLVIRQPRVVSTGIAQLAPGES